MANYPTGLNGWLYMSQTEYNNTTHDSNTKYTVKNGDTVTEYLGDVMIVSEEGDSWVTMLLYETEKAIMTETITGIADRVTALETWKSGINTDLSEIETSLTALESWKQTADSEISTCESYISTLNSWKTQISSVISQLQSAVALLQATAVTSEDIRVIDVVDVMPENPVSTTLYIANGDES